MAIVTGDNKFSTAKFIVSPNLSDGATHTTISSAMNDASNGDIIFVREGTYTEDITLKLGVSIRGADYIGGKTVIKGKITISGTGAGEASTLSYLKLETNSNYSIDCSVGGTFSLYVDNCYLHASDFDHTNFSSASINVQIRFTHCFGVTGASVKQFVNTSTGVLSYYYCDMRADTSSARSSSSTGLVRIIYTNWFSPIDFTGDAEFRARYSLFNPQVYGSAIDWNSTALDEDRHTLDHCEVTCVSALGSGANGINIGSGSNLQVYNCIFNMGSAFPYAIGGSGTLDIANTTFQGYNRGINVTNITPSAGGVYGSWTPIMKGATSAGTGTYAAQKGRYEIFGRKVYFTAYVSWTAHSGTGGTRFTLPFTPSGESNLFHTFSVWIRNFTFPSNSHIQGEIDPSNIDAKILSITSGSSAAAEITLPSSGSIVCSGFYEI